MIILPFGHERTVSRVPYLTFAIIAACTLVQIYSTWFAPDLDAIRDAMDRAKTVEEYLAIGRGVDPDQIPILRFGYEAGSGIQPNLIASAFVHDGWLHLIGNMLFLWLAGSALEDRLGRIKFAILYVGGAAAAALCWSQLSTGPAAIAVGASGAVSALMGGFLVHFASTRIMLFYWFLIRAGTFRLAAYFVLPLWFGEQILYAWFQHATPGLDNIGYTAHIGGFVFGFAITFAAKGVFGIGREPTDETAEPLARAVAVPVDARYQRCLDAAAARDAGALRPLASRVILDLQRAGEHERLLALYQAISRKLKQLPLTDGAFLAAANAAQKLNDQRTYVEILEAALREQATSRLVPEFHQRLAASRR